MFEQQRLVIVQSTKVAQAFDSGRLQQLFVGPMIRYIILESLFDVLRRAVISLSGFSVDTTLYGVTNLPEDSIDLISESDKLSAHNSYLGWACVSLLNLYRRRSMALSESSSDRKKW